MPSETKVYARELIKLYKKVSRNVILPSDILNEIQEIRFKKPVDKPKYSVNLLRYALLLRYTSTQAYKLLLEQFPLPPLSLLKKLKVE